MATNGLLVLFEHCLCREHRNFPPCNSPMQFYYCSMVQQETIDASGMWVNTWNCVFLLNIYIYVWTENQNNSSMLPKMDIQSLHFSMPLIYFRSSLFYEHTISYMEWILNKYFSLHLQTCASLHICSLHKSHIMLSTFHKYHDSLHKSHIMLSTFHKYHDSLHKSHIMLSTFHKYHESHTPAPYEIMRSCLGCH
jgi:hypothetical protein